MQRRIFGSIVLTAVIAFLATAAPAQPTSAPSTRPTIIPDSSTPKGTLLIMARGAVTGDAKSVRNLFNATNPQQVMLADMLTQRTVVMAQFRQALIKALNEDAANQIVPDPATQAALAEKRIGEAEVKIDNDKATVQMEGQPVQLVRVDGQWKLEMSPLTEGMSPEDVADTVKQTKVLSNVLTQISEELIRGKYKTSDEVSDALRSKMATAMLQQASEAPPAAQPKTAP